MIICNRNIGKMSLNEKQVEEFKSKGFIVLKNFFKTPDMDRVSKYLDDLCKKDGGNEAKYYEISTINNNNILVRIENVMTEHNLELKNLLITMKAKECLSRLLGESPVLFKDKINYKLPGCRADKLHQDQSAGWNAYADFFITMGIVADKIGKDNSALSFMNSGNYKYKLMVPEWNPLSEEDPPYQPENEYTLLEADPGDIIFFDSYVPHGSPANTGNRSRRIIFLTFNKLSSGDMRTKYYADKWKRYAPNKAVNARESKTFLV